MLDKPTPRLCAESANLLKTIGFFGLAGKLYECAFYLNQTDIDMAANVFESYWSQHKDDKRHVQRFRFIYEKLLEEQNRE